MPLAPVLVAASLVAGCGGGDKAHGGEVTIVTDIDVTTERGTFRVTRGSQALGCSGGTFVTHHLGQDAWLTASPPHRYVRPGHTPWVAPVITPLQKVLNCTEGERNGSLLIRIRFAHSGYRWNFENGTGDFAGVKGKGRFSWRRNPDPSGVETLTGNAAF